MECYEYGNDKRIQLEINDYVKIEIAGYVMSGPKSECPAHRHPFWELIYIEEGDGIHHIGNTSVPFKKGGICLIPPGVTHSTVHGDLRHNNKIYIGFSFHYSFAEGTEDDIQKRLDHMTGLEEIKGNLAKLCRILKKDECSAEHIPMEKLIEMTASIAAHISGKKTSVPNIQEIRKQNMADKVKSYLEANLCRTVRLDELGSMLYLTPHYISDTFRQVTGMHVKEYHKMLRMQYAYRLLLETELSITEISEQLGFESIHYFSKCFKERYTFSPSNLRKGVHIKNSDLK